MRCALRPLRRSTDPAPARSFLTPRTDRTCCNKCLVTQTLLVSCPVGLHAVQLECISNADAPDASVDALSMSFPIEIHAAHLKLRQLRCCQTRHDAKSRSVRQLLLPLIFMQTRVRRPCPDQHTQRHKKLTAHASRVASLPWSTYAASQETHSACAARCVPALVNIRSVTRNSQRMRHLLRPCGVVCFVQTQPADKNTSVHE